MLETTIPDCTSDYTFSCRNQAGCRSTASELQAVPLSEYDRTSADLSADVGDTLHIKTISLSCLDNCHNRRACVSTLLGTAEKKILP